MLKLLLIIAGLYLLLLGAMYFGQRRLLYFPDPVRISPATVGLADVAERIIETPDGEKLVAWHGKARPGQPTLLYFHGNGGGLSVRANRFRQHLDRGRGVFMLAYRGYSGSTGAPSEAANVADARLAHAALVGQGVHPRDIILYGESLGTGVAVQVAGGKPAAGLILESPFTSIVDRAVELYPWLPVRQLVKDRYDSQRHIPQLRLPLLILHGAADTVVPVRMGRRLFVLAKEPKQLVVLPGAEHNDLDRHGAFAAIDSWIDRLRAGVIR